jgi:hypothetical protein
VAGGQAAIQAAGGMAVTSDAAGAQDPGYRPQSVDSWPDGGVYTVVATSAANAWALGSTDLGQQLLIRHWDGSTWTQVSEGKLPAAGGRDAAGGRSAAGRRDAAGRVSAAGSLNEVLGSAATSADDVWGVGLTGAGRRGLIVHWDGSAWRQVALPELGGVDSGLAAVAALTPQDAWAVGQAADSTQTLILHWEWSGRPWPAWPPSRRAARGRSGRAATRSAP